MAVEFAKLVDPLIEWVHKQGGENPLADSSILPFAQDHGMTDHQAYELLRYCESKDLLDGRHSTLGDARAQLTPYGLEVVEERLRRRSSPAARSAAARKALLIWLWHRKHDGTHFRTRQHSGVGRVPLRGRPPHDLGSRPSSCVP